MPSGYAKIGLEITSKQMRIAVCSNGRITHALSITLPDNLVNQGRVVSYETLAEVLRNALKTEGITAKNLALSLPPRDVYTRHMVMPAMTVDELELNLPYEFKGYISEDTAKYTFDYAVFDTVLDEDGIPVELDIIAAAVLTQTVEDFASMASQSGLRLKIAAPEVMAYCNLIESNGPADYCFLGLGATETRVHMFPKGRFEVTRTVNVGITDMVNAVAEYFAIDHNVARSYLFSDYEGAASIPACMDLYNMLAMELARIVSFYGFSFPESALETVHICGVGGSIVPLVGTLNEQLSVNLESVSNLMPSEGLPPNVLEQCVVAVGMAMQNEGGR